MNLTLFLLLATVCPSLGWVVPREPKVFWNANRHFSPSNRNRLPIPALQSQNQVEGAQENLTEKEDPAAPPPTPALRELYPPSTAHTNGTLQVDSIHTLYYEVHGNPNKPGKSALFLHGGPGAGCTPTHARFFNPDYYSTIVLFDQRGCGRSTPRGQVHNNTIWHLIQDCEQLRHHILGNDQVWDVVLGGSWGSTLAIAYAQEYPNSVKSMILRGVCLLRPSEVDWLFTPQGGAAQRNPAAWKAFAETVGIGPKQPEMTPQTTRAIGPDVPFQNDASMTIGVKPVQRNPNDMDVDRNVLHRYYDRMFGLNTQDRWTAARGWMTWEFTVSSSYRKQGANHSSPAVLVYEPTTRDWTYQDGFGNNLQPTDISRLSLTTSASEASHQLRKVLPLSDRPPAHARPIGLSLEDFEKATDEQYGNFSGLPAMSMLTCFYSVNDHYAMNGWNLIVAERMRRIRHIPCIAIQGGNDPICPPDTALDLLHQWPELELRIPLMAGHSMYDPDITNELVRATDQLASN